MEKGQEGSGDLTKKEPIEFRGMGEGAIKALVGEEELAKLKEAIKAKQEGRMTLEEKLEYVEKHGRIRLGE